MSICAIILIGGPQKGTRLRPLSLDVPKALVCIAGKSVVEHQILALSTIKTLSQIYIIGNYDNANDQFNLDKSSHRKDIKISYVNEETPRGTAGALTYLKNHLFLEGFKTLIVSHCDVVCNYPFKKMRNKSNSLPSLYTSQCAFSYSQAPQDVSHHFGCLILNDSQVVHYVEKPQSYISDNINAGVSILDISVIDVISNLFRCANLHTLDLGKDIYPLLVDNHSLFSYPLDGPWCSIKSPSAALHANRLLLSFNENSNIPSIQHSGNVYIHESAVIHPTAFIGPNVSIGAKCIIKSGVRISEAILLEGSIINDNCFIKDTIIGNDCVIESWCRIEGKHIDGYFDYFKKVKAKYSYFTQDGRLYPSVAVL
ncbi:hypothetical protein HZS_6091, partial [Henneguya salminicola]